MKKIFTILVLLAVLGLSGSIKVKAQLITNGLIAYYPLNGNANDLSGNNLNGTATSPLPTTGHSGVPNSAYLFNGSSDYILVPQNNLLAPANELSVSVWVQPRGFWAGRDQGNVIVENGNELGSAWGLLYNDNDGQPLVLDTTTEKFSFGIWFADGTKKGVQCPNNVHTNNWYHLCFTYDGAIERLYVNNVLVDTAHVSKLMGTTTADMTIGRYIEPTQPLVWPYYVNGVIDELYIFDRALTEEEVNTLFTANVNVNEFEKQKESINVFPNPTNDHITIDFGRNNSTPKGYTLKIINLLGQTVYTTPINNQQTTVDLSTLMGNGIYIIHLIDEQSNTIEEIRKFVLQK